MTQSLEQERELRKFLDTKAAVYLFKMQGRNEDTTALIEVRLNPLPFFFLPDTIPL